MTKPRVLLWILCIAVSMLLLSADSCDSGPTNTNGFSVHTEEGIVDSGGGTVTTDSPGIYVLGSWLTDNGIASGTVQSFQAFTSFFRGIYFVEQGRAPAHWSLSEGTGPCLGQRVFADVAPGSEQRLVCVEGRTVIFALSPGSVTASQGQTYLFLSGQGIDATYGPPQVWVFDEQGQTTAHGDAPSWGADGTWVSGTPDLSGALTGNYLVAVRNVQSDGSLVTIGYAMLMVYGNDPTPPPDGGGSCDGSACIMNQ